ncbi:hypothetical protein LPY66_19560 [Dehalobacter sp. DCM]|uniref:hypothetical protein n=1 Tax=Dehalobacter sp. DCM TaxID=2907827 RepID=UPI003081E0FA|nr:hypothetical protein LPY66_19560 [Dehalobacter sp. DCM]
MKKVIISVLLISFLLLAGSGCSSKENAKDQNTAQEGQTTQEGQTAQGSGTEKDGDDISVIVKSDTPTSNAEKEQILDDINSQLNEIINEANKLDDIAEKDMKQ